ncbi:DNA cytosine methyltransferase [Achromobacter sp. DH1f]|uniref:DNA cytosine methyltransferase n=1 Tax=Achromobacter sp. DH1f TaxID=1397275 RepID=UPI0004680DEA|nr:DNA cytosine methyltransferase [Achromobacter sp. DH1f]
METAIDLFAGLGGNSEGARQVGVRVVWAANHSRPAVDTHAENHPEAIHVCQDLHQANWSKVPSSDIIIASPACTGHTNARGKDKPHHDIARSTASAVVDAVEFHRPPFFLVENVPEFAKWVRYQTWCASMHALGYALSPVIWDAADCGVPQHRKRILIIGTRSKHPIQLVAPSRPHRPVSEIIDFNAGTWSPIDRPGRSPKTLSRVRAGRRQFGDRFVMPYYGSGSGLTGRSLDRPLGTITTRARWAVVDGDRMRMLTTAENCAGMGFPAHYRLPANGTLALHMLGNANPPPLAAYAIDAIRKAA